MLDKKSLSEQDIQIAHRDLKPDIIMIARDDYPRALDFGLARRIEPQRTKGATRAVQIKSGGNNDLEATIGRRRAETINRLQNR